MRNPDYILNGINQRYRRCLAPARQQRTARRWEHHPALAGRTVNEIAAIVTDGYHPDHNPVAAALLDAHHRRDLTDDDAETLLLVAIRPLVLLLDPNDTNNDNRAGLWHAAGWRLAAMTPASILNHRSPFLVVMFGRLRAARTKPDPRPRTVTLRDVSGDDRDVVADQAMARLDLHQLTQQPGWDRLASWLDDGITSGVHRQWVARTRARMAATVGYAA